MSPPKAVRRIAASAIGVGAGAGAIGLLLVGEGAWARNTIGNSLENPPSPNGVYGDDLGGPPLSVLIIGDSSVVGYGMSRVDDTPPAMLGVGLAHVLDRPIHVTSQAVVGALSRDLDAQIDAGIDSKPNFALIVVGANDVTHARRPRRAAGHLADAVTRLRESGAKVIVATCPDLGTIQPLPQPLRLVARVLSRQHAAAQAAAGVRAGARTVSLAGLLGDLFKQNAEVMFGIDRFHPSREGYANMISVILPVIVSSARERDFGPLAGAPRDLMPIAEAATRAAWQGGTELAPAGKWAFIRRQRRWRRGRTRR